MTAGAAFILILLGMVCMYGEFIWPGRVFPCLAGSLLMIAGVEGLARMHLSSWGMTLIALGFALFLVEAFWGINLVAGIIGTALLSVGASLLVRAPAHLSPELTVPACTLFGGLTVFLCWKAKRARRNKWSDLAELRAGWITTRELSGPEAVD
jgi:membrane-bound ClpP family serine protease